MVGPPAFPEESHEFFVGQAVNKLVVPQRFAQPRFPFGILSVTEPAIGHEETLAGHHVLVSAAGASASASAASDEDDHDPCQEEWHGTDSL